jgi:hypothetical protein
MVAASHTTEHILALLELRVAVAFLGEHGQNGWWKTQFLQPTGQRFLEFIYPRTAFAAAVTAATEAAKKFHDERIGKGGVFHLFRFPPTLEFRVHQQLLSSDAARLAQIVTNASAARALLERYVKNKQPTALGPLRIGEVSAITKEITVAKLAGIYLQSISSATVALPYFTAAHE